MPPAFVLNVFASVEIAWSALTWMLNFRSEFVNFSDGRLAKTIAAGDKRLKALQSKLEGKARDHSDPSPTPAAAAAPVRECRKCHKAGHYRNHCKNRACVWFDDCTSLKRHILHRAEVQLKALKERQQQLQDAQVCLIVSLLSAEFAIVRQSARRWRTRRVRLPTQQSARFSKTKGACLFGVIIAITPTFVAGLLPRNRSTKQRAADASEAALCRQGSSAA